MYANIIYLQTHAACNKRPFDSLRLWLMQAMDIPVREKKVPKKREWWRRIYSFFFIYFFFLSLGLSLFL